MSKNTQPPHRKNNAAKPGPNKDGTGSGRSVRSGNYVARARKKNHWRDSEFRKKVLVGFTAFIAVAIIVPVVAFFTAYSVTKVPEPEELVNNQVSYIMASDNKTELARIIPPEGNRTNVDVSEIPEHVREAVLAAEDRDFYDNPGFSLTGFGRAALGQLTGNASAGGGSTITQQYVKNAMVGDELSITRKAKELVISSKMAREWSKDEILGAYLNTIYFGRNAYGINSAAHAYFNKDVKDLTVEEGAVLAASIQSPHVLDPWTNRERAESRWNYVLDGMLGMGSITQEQRDTAEYPKAQDPAKAGQTSQAKGTNGLIKQAVIRELEEAGINENQVNTGGLKITTTIDPKVQESVVDEVHQQFEGAMEGIRGAVVSIDPKTGGVRGYYGGDDPVGWDYANAPMQTGSTFKIFGLAAYLDQGGSIYDNFDSSPVTTGQTEVTNVGGESCGSCSIAQALKMSLNTSFIRLTRSLDGGAQAVADMAHRLGVAEELPGFGKTLQEDGGTPYEGIVLGQYQSRPMDMAAGLATLSNEGVFHRPHFVKKVENSNGEVLLDNTKPEGDQVIDKEIANAVIEAMGPIAGYSNGNALANGRPSAAKTGTAQLGDSGRNKDAWMIGSTPQLATAVWIGTVDNRPLVDQWGGTMYGSGMPATIWKNVMDRSLVDDPIENWGSGGEAAAGVPDNGGYVEPENPQPEPEQEQEQPSPEAPAPQPEPATPPRQGGGNTGGGGVPPAPDLGQIIDDLLG